MPQIRPLAESVVTLKIDALTYLLNIWSRDIK